MGARVLAKENGKNVDVCSGVFGLRIYATKQKWAKSGILATDEHRSTADLSILI